ncbi:MAG: class I SAM-dependent methyltransferase [Planctomycetes bacterium]|nr:class I SAM-dependent methyltransferase [Planctomycetota bacterium]
MTRDRTDIVRFLRSKRIELSMRQRLALVRRLTRVTNAVRGYHTLGEILAITTEILERERPVVVEAGVGPGSSTVKLSIATALAGGRLFAFDTFRGIPDNDEVHTHLGGPLGGRQLVFRKGAFRATLPRVQRAIDQWGEPGLTRLIKGHVEETLPKLDAHVDVAILDLDLIASTRAAIRALWPKLVPGGVLLSIDGQLRATHELLADKSFWQDDLGCDPPEIRGLWRDKLLRIGKPDSASPETPPGSSCSASDSDCTK